MEDVIFISLLLLEIIIFVYPEIKRCNANKKNIYTDLYNDLYNNYINICKHKECEPLNDPTIKEMSDHIKSIKYKLRKHLKTN